MRQFKLFVSLAIMIWAAVGAVWAQNPPPPFTIRLQPFLPTGVVSRPVLLTHSKDGSGRKFILQQDGFIKVLQPGSFTPTEFINIASRVRTPTSAGDERGLLGLTFHPQFATNHKFYVNYTRIADGATVVAEYTTLASNPNQGDFNSERIIITIPQPFTNHNGGMIEFGSDGYLYIGMGDGGSANDPGARAQNLSQLLGKMLRIDVNVPQGSPTQYLIPAGNPFTGANTTRCESGSTTSGQPCQEIWAYGLRNPWRWSFDRTTNQQWVADVGQGVIEEVDIVTPGANYGWRVYEGTQCTGLDPQLCAGGMTPIAHTPPIFQYSHTGGRCSITGGYVYRGSRGSLPGGAYIYGDYCSGEIWMWNGNQQILLADTPRQIISFGEDADGEIYVCYSNGQIDKVVRAKANADFDGDFKTDISVYRPAGGFWYINQSLNNTFRAQQFGIDGDIPAPEDYDGDNTTDIAVFRPSSGSWYVLRSSTNTFFGVQFGANGDSPAASDYDGDAKADFAVFRPNGGNWYILNSSNGAFSATQFGANGDIAVPGDYDGDGKYDLAVYRGSSGSWYRLNSSNGSFSAAQFGASADTTAQGDFDGDGRTDISVFRSSDGTWYRLNSSNGAFVAVQFGTNGDRPVVGDYDGDAKDDIAVFRPTGGNWYRLNSSNGAFVAAQFGQNGDIYLPAFDQP
ncbi:MAG TPA: PQQ-dependent sugar dehydrogenase [Pyrinomonadaceae bacterium]